MQIFFKFPEQYSFFYLHVFCQWHGRKYITDPPEFQMHKFKQSTQALEVAN